VYFRLTKADSSKNYCSLVIKSTRELAVLQLTGLGLTQLKALVILRPVSSVRQMSFFHSVLKEKQKARINIIGSRRKKYLIDIGEGCYV
jgi:hypothetical protein